MISVKRVYEPAAASDGTRVLVDRLWPRGLRKEDARLDEWLRDIAPSPELRKWYAHDAARWEEFQARYRAELATPERLAHLERLAAIARTGTLTLLYAAREERHNSAVVLAQMLEKL